MSSASYAKGKNKIGTTKRGIGPAYGDKAARDRPAHVRSDAAEVFAEKLPARIKENNAVLKALRRRSRLISRKCNDAYLGGRREAAPVCRRTPWSICTRR